MSTDPKKQLKTLLNRANPTLASHMEQLATNDHLEEMKGHLKELVEGEKAKKDPQHDEEDSKFIRSFRESFRGSAGPKGEDGKTPQKGVDYFDGKDGETPQRGVHYFTDEDILWLKDQIITQDILEKATPIKGVHYHDGIDGQSIKGDPGNDGISIEGLPGKDGVSPKIDDIVKAVVKKLTDEPTLEFKHLKDGATVVGNLPRRGTGYKLSDQRYGSHGTPTNPQIPSGTINGVNTTFTVTGSISALFLNGGFQIPSGTDYTLSGTTITFVNPPPSGSNLFGI